MSDLPVEKLVKIGMSELEAKAYLALLGESPVTGYQLARSSGVPRSMIHEVMGKLVTAAILIVLAWWRFEKRDIRVGGARLG